MNSCSINLNNSYGNTVYDNKKSSEKYNLKDFSKGCVSLLPLLGTGVINTVVNSKISPAFANVSSSIQDEFRNSAKLAFDKTNIASKGVEFIDTSKITDSQIKELIDNSLSKSSKLPKFLQNMRIKDVNTAFKMSQMGANAYFLPEINKIAVNLELNPYSSCHEIGHAMNKYSKFGKILQSSRKLGILALPVILITAFKKNKPQGEKPVGVVDKVTTFVKDNSGKLAFAAWLPTLLEEGLASIKGAKLAKGILSPEAFKKMNVLNLRGFATYFIAASCAALGCSCIKYVQEKFATK